VDAGAAPAILTCLEQTLRQGAWSGEREVRTKDNKKLQMHSAWRLLGDAPNVPRSCLVVDTDLTEKKQLEAQLLRAQRLESIGRLAGGLAHDINNILGSLLLSVPFLREEVQSKEGREVLEVMETGIQRGGNILKQVLTFARGTPQRRELVSSRVLLREIEKIVRGTFPQSILVRCLRSRGLWSLLADATQLHQMLLNLCVNARDAMSGGGRLLLSAKNVQLEQDFVRLVPEAKVGPYVEMVVADTGIGIPAENLDLIFDPFFTTKAPDAGTGLGLSTVLGIVKGHGGFVRVTSQPGRGTQFNVYLPAAEVAAKASPSRRAPAVAEGQGRLILLADDEKGLASVSRRVLEAQGYRVLTANDGSKAIALFDQHQREIDLVITDLQMPVLDGVAVVKHIRSLDPRARIIVSTGDLAGLPVSRSAELASVTTLWKPFTAEVLLRTVDTALKAPRRCASPSQAGGEPRPGLEGARQTRKPGARTVRDRRVPVQGEGNAAMAERPKP
jgi:signal transduction histidine kinase/DNA-binding NarL/FixJ family response regulator